ncbi:DEAD/DEAH box helicase [Chromobacterium haemolyticum]|nr:DEAD/DEAH box helicase [Chromobacterium haemolyticum]
MPFTSLGLSPALAQAASDQGYPAPTAVQFAAVPAILQGHDVLATAQTGSAKPRLTACRCCSNGWRAARPRRARRKR